MGYLQFGCRCLLIVVFAWSAFGKVAGTEAFVAFRRATARLFPPARRIAAHVGVAVIVAEATIVVLLGIPSTVHSGFIGALGLLAVFTVAVATAVRRGNQAPCNCFGRSASPLGPRHLVRNAVLLLCAGTGLAAAPAGNTELAGLLMAGLAGVVVAALVVSFDALADLFLERIPT